MVKNWATDKSVRKFFPHRHAARWQCGQAAQIVIALLRRMKVRAGGCRESELPCVRCECRVVVRPVAAAHPLDRRAAQIAEFRQQCSHLRRVQRIPAGMGEHGGAPAAVDPTYCSTQGRPLMRNKTRLAAAEETLESGLDVLHNPLPDA